MEADDRSGVSMSDGGEEPRDAVLGGGGLDNSGSESSDAFDSFCRRIRPRRGIQANSHTGGKKKLKGGLTKAKVRRCWSGINRGFNNIDFQVVAETIKDLVKTEMSTYGRDGAGTSTQKEVGNLLVVPAEFRHQIKRGEFVDFNAMLSSLAGKCIIPGYALALKTDSKTPQILIAQQEEKPYIHDLQMWMKDDFVFGDSWILSSAFVGAISEVPSDNCKILF